jgi:hypothetical protein
MFPAAKVNAQEGENGRRARTEDRSGWHVQASRRRTSDEVCSGLATLEHVVGRRPKVIIVRYDLLAVGIVLFLGCFIFWRRRKLDKAWEGRFPRSAFAYCGRTLLFYDRPHGNQVEFLDSDGRCYLWYPGNTAVVVGRWRSDGECIHFRYGINTYNPVTGVIGGRWEPRFIDLWSMSIVDDAPGDPLGIKKRIPFVLERHPAISSIEELKSMGR